MINYMQKSVKGLRSRKGGGKMKTGLEKEFQYYIDHQADLLKKYSGKVLVIKDCRVIGVYGSEIEAIEKTVSKYALGTFLVQKCSPGSESYTQTYHSRVIFA